MEAIMKHIALLALLFVTIGGFTSRSALAQHDDATNRRLTAYVNAFNDTLSKGKLDDWMGLWAQHAERVMPHDRQEGITEIRSAYEGILGAYTSIRLVENTRKVKGHEGVIECQFEAVTRGSGLTISQPVTLTMHFDIFGKITLLKAEYDEEALARQLSAKRA
jgi:hypothetical protein